MSNSHTEAHTYFDYIKEASPNFVQIGGIPHKNKQGKEEITDYMGADDRMKWALSSWRPMVEDQAEAFMNRFISGELTPDQLVTLLRAMGWHILCHMEESKILHTADFEIAVGSYCIASCFIRDPMGNEVKEYAMCSRGQWPAFVEKAMTKATARALKKFGFGTAFAIDMDDDEHVSVTHNPANLADGPIDLTSQHERPTEPAKAPTSSSPAIPKAVTPASTPKAAPATDNPRNIDMTEKSKHMIAEMAVFYPGFVRWVRKSKFAHLSQDKDIRQTGSEADAQKLKLNKEDWVNEWLVNIHPNKSLEQVIEEVKAKLAMQGKTYEQLAAENGVTLPQQAPMPQPTSTVVNEAVYDEHGADNAEDFDEETEAPLPIEPEIPDEMKVRPGDPLSPSKEDMKIFQNLIAVKGGIEVIGLQLKKQWPWTTEKIRKQYLTEENPKASIRTCWTRQDLKEAMAFVNDLPDPQAKAA